MKHIHLPHFGYIVQKKSKLEKTGDSSVTSWEIGKALYIADSEQEPDIVSVVRPQPQDCLWTIAIAFHQGDSFCSHLNAEICFIDLFEEKSQAQALKTLIFKATEKKFPYLDYIDNLGLNRRIAMPWTDVFSGIGFCEVLELNFGYRPC